MINTKDLRKWDEVRIEWEDIVGSGSLWESEKEEKDNPLTVALCHTCGFVVKGWSKNAKSLLICGSVSDGIISDKTIFPKGCIRRVFLRSRMTEKWVWEPRHLVVMANE